MTTIQIVSDLHIEQYEDVPNPLDFITPSADILILAGDIGSFYRIQQLIDFLKALCSYFKIVLYVPGNHEWYTMNDNESLSFDSLEKRMLTIENKIKNFYILYALIFYFIINSESDTPILPTGKIFIAKECLIILETFLSGQ